MWRCCFVLSKRARTVQLYALAQYLDPRRRVHVPAFLFLSRMSILRARCARRRDWFSAETANSHSTCTRVRLCALLNAGRSLIERRTRLDSGLETEETWRGMEAWCRRRAVAGVARRTVVSGPPQRRGRGSGAWVGQATSRSRDRRSAVGAAAVHMGRAGGTVSAAAASWARRRREGGSSRAAAR